MDASTARELRAVRRMLVGAGVVSAIIAVSAFRQSQKTRFTEIDVERINVFEKDGKLRLTISNAERLPQPIIGGKSYPLRGGTGAGSGGMTGRSARPSWMCPSAHAEFARTPGAASRSVRRSGSTALFAPIAPSPNAATSRVSGVRDPRRSTRPATIVVSR